MDLFLRALHILAAAVWVGGIAFLGLVAAPVLRRELPPAQRIVLLSKVGRRFDPIGWGALVVLAITGIAQILRTGVPLNLLFSTSYGALLLTKLGLVALIVLATAVHSYVWGPRLEALAAQAESLEATRLRRRMAALSGTNLLAALIVFVLGVYLAHG
ncbi:MAG: DUF4149 domain-containing protein [Chloroflexi bacterium]|nr:DUF4149 domain-containing protein [Chloroflexota bacterium]